MFCVLNWHFLRSCVWILASVVFSRIWQHRVCRCVSLGERARVRLFVRLSRNTEGMVRAFVNARRAMPLESVLDVRASS